MGDDGDPGRLQAAGRQRLLLSELRMRRRLHVRLLVRREVRRSPLRRLLQRRLRLLLQDSQSEVLLKVAR